MTTAVEEARWVVNHHTHGATVHHRDCPYVDPSMQPHPLLRKATTPQVEQVCRVARRTKLCRRCAKRVVL